MEGSEEACKSSNGILIFGGTGYIGKYVVDASIKSGYKTYVYARPITPNSSPEKAHLHRHFQAIGVTVVEGELHDHQKIVAALRRVDIVISALAYPQVLDQLKIIHAIKVAGNIKRFLPSEFGCEIDRVGALPPFQACLDDKRKIRRAIEEAGIPYTFVSSNCCGAYFVNYLLHPHDKQQNDVVCYGSGEAKAVLNYEKDIAMYTIKAANDPRACNRVIICRPPKNIVSQLQLISLWEGKTGRTFERIHVPEEELVKLSESLPHPKNIPVAIIHSVFVEGDTVSFQLREEDMEVSKMYPDYEYTTIDEVLDIFLGDPPKPAAAAFE